MILRRALAALGLVLTLGACATESVWAPDEAVARAAHVPEGPPSLTLMTMISNRDGSGQHSALLIDGSQRVLFDPAGTWWHPQAPERNDVVFGMHDALFAHYMDYHARETFHVVVQEVPVSAEVAEHLIAAVQEYGPVPNAQCSISITRILSRTPGFESLGTNWFPRRTMNAFAELPGVQTNRVYDDDPDENGALLVAQQQQL